MRRTKTRAAFVHTALGAQLDRTHTCTLWLRWPGATLGAAGHLPLTLSDPGLCAHHARVVLAVLTSAVVLAGSSGAYGKVLIDPARPVCAIGLPCTAPDPHDVLAFWRGTRRIASVTTAADGSYRVALAPGLYRVTLPRRTVARARLSPVEIRIPLGRFVRVTFRVDVGIR